MKLRALVLTAVSLFAFGVVIFAYLDDATDKAPNPNGDLLGQDYRESFAEYKMRADATLGGDEPAFGLLTFLKPQGPEEAAGLLDPVPRVSALVIAQASPFAIPEPVAGEDRAAVFQRRLSAIEAPHENLIDAVVVYATPSALAPISGEFAAMEFLPPDAAWGRFGVRPVEVDQ